jgi:hypothetical protein
VLEVDEGTMYRYDYVRLRIACRDVSRVPKTAEGTLGLYIINFVFERAVPEEKSKRTLKSGIRITEDAPPPPKKTKADPPSEKPAQDKESEEVGGKQTSDISTSKGVQCYWSAPPKIDFKRKSRTKLMSDAQKAYLNEDEGDMGEKVHIHDTLEDSDSDSDSFTIKVQKLTGVGEPSNTKAMKLTARLNMYGSWKTGMMISITRLCFLSPQLMCSVPRLL